MEDPHIRKQYDSALSGFVARAKNDKRVLAIIIYGSMAYDQVTERSNINAYVIVDEGQHRSARLIEQGVPIDIHVYSRDTFLKHLQHPRGAGMRQSLAYSKLAFSRDCSFTDFYKGLDKHVGNRDLEYLRIIYFGAVRYDFEKAEKYLYIKDDLPHSLHFFLHGISELGYLICYLNDVFPPREVILKGRQYEPVLYEAVFDKLIDSELTKEVLEEGFRRAYTFLDSVDIMVHKPVLDFISENGGTASQTELWDRFRQRGLGFIEIEHLHRRGILRRTVNPVKLTRKGVVEYNEALFHFSWDGFDPEKVRPTSIGPADVNRERVLADYQGALEELKKKTEADEYVLNLMVGGSLSYDTVWEKSDIDVMIVTRDEPYSTRKGFVEKDVFIEGEVVTRERFRRGTQRISDGSIFQSYFYHSTLIHSKDDTILDIYEDARNIGSRDVENVLLLNYIYARDLITKADKALYVKEDPHFAFNFMMSGIRRLANIEVLLNRTVPLRESTVQALKLNPTFFKEIFLDLLNAPVKSSRLIKDTLEMMKNYLDGHLRIFIQPIHRLLEKEEEMTHYDLKDRFNQIQLPLDLRAFVERGLLFQTEAPIRLTKKSSSEMVQPAYQLPIRVKKDMDIEDMLLA